jgi:LysM repeat protein
MRRRPPRSRVALRSVVFLILGGALSVGIWRVWFSSPRTGEARLASDAGETSSGPGMALAGVAAMAAHADPTPSADPAGATDEAELGASALAAHVETEEVLEPRAAAEPAPGVERNEQEPDVVLTAAPVSGAPEAQAARPVEPPRRREALDGAPRASASPRDEPLPNPARHPAVEQGLKRYRAGQVLDARRELNRLLSASAAESEQDETRRVLARIADETLFGRRRVGDDPLTQTHTVKAGETLLKIAPAYNVPYEAIMRMNGISNPATLREGRALVVPKGPFHARIHRASFRMDLYLADQYVRSFPVGLGADGGTPTGVWKVNNRQRNPTYYPPPSASDKRVYAPNDPKNPLGGFWIGLEGIEGDAAGQSGFGIHGTIEPDSIGRNASLGCVRMYNEDAAIVFDLLASGKSNVTILPD